MTGIMEYLVKLRKRLVKDILDFAVMLEIKRMGRKTVTEKFDLFIQLLVTVVKFHTFTTRLNFEVKLMPLILFKPSKFSPVTSKCVLVFYSTHFRKGRQ